MYIKELVLVPWIIVKERTVESKRRRELYSRIKSVRNKLVSKVTTR